MNPQLASLLNHAIQCLQSGDLEGADAAVGKAISIDINNADAHHIHGVIYGLQNKHDEALKALLKAVKLKPEDGVLQFNLANALMESRQFSESLSHYKVATQLMPDNPDVWINYGKSLRELKYFDDALMVYEKAISLNQTDAEAWNNKGVTLNALKRFDEAIACFDKALGLHSDYAEAWFNRGFTLQDLKLNNDAIASYERALALKPDYAEAWNNKAIVLQDLKLNNEAIASYERALALKPDYAEAWGNKGAALNQLKYFDEAISHYDKAISLDPNNAKAWYNKGIALNEFKNFEGAIAHYDKALNLDPNMSWANGDLIHAKMKICNWSDFDLLQNKIIKRVFLGEKAIAPFALLALINDAACIKKSAETYSQDKFPFNNVLGPILNSPKREKIRIGYFSADFRDHAVSMLAAELFELHDKNQFEVIAFSFGVDDKSPMRLRLMEAFSQFIDVSDKSDLEIAKLARELQIDIAIDLGGYTAETRTGIFAYRAAPIQVSYLGYLGTMNVEYIDYIFADKTTIPEELQSYYSEKIVYLPSYQVNDRKRKISDRVFTKNELGLPEKGFIFCCFNNNYKILPATFDGWMRILNAVEGSVLFLYSDNKLAEENLKQEAESRGVDSSRLVFGKRIPTDEYLSRYRSCDLFLDTFPYNAGTTASDALWAGLPVLTLTGESFASRMAASLLNAIGIPELITNTQEEYESLAITLAKNPHKLELIKRKLADGHLNSLLFDSPRCAQNIESVYKKMYERYQAGLALDNIF